MLEIPGKPAFIFLQSRLRMPADIKFPVLRMSLIGPKEITLHETDHGKDIAKKTVESICLYDDDSLPIAPQKDAPNL